MQNDVTKVKVALLIDDQWQHKLTARLFCQAHAENKLDIVNIIIRKQVANIRFREIFRYSLSQLLAKCVLWFDSFKFRYFVENKEELNYPVTPHFVSRFDYDTLSQSNLDADFIIVHSRALISLGFIRESTGLVMGAHPGLVSKYRGSHSLVQALARKDVKNVGFSVFALGSDIDSTDRCIERGVSLKSKSFVELNTELNFYSYKFILDNLENIEDMFVECSKGEYYQFPKFSIALKAMLNRRLLEEKKGL